MGVEAVMVGYPQFACFLWNFFLQGLGREGDIGIPALPRIRRRPGDDCRRGRVYRRRNPPLESYCWFLQTRHVCWTE